LKFTLKCFWNWKCKNHACGVQWFAVHPIINSPSINPSMEVFHV
jgi:hypothetical protein